MYSSPFLDPGPLPSIFRFTLLVCYFLALFSPFIVSCIRYEAWKLFASVAANGAVFLWNLASGLWESMYWSKTSLPFYDDIFQYFERILTVTSLRSYPSIWRSWITFGSTIASIVGFYYNKVSACYHVKSFSGMISSITSKLANGVLPFT